MKNDLREELKVSLQSAPFKTVFKATLAFYVAQALISLLGISVVLAVIVAVKYLM